MGLAEILGARAARQGRSATVACGELGTVTVEALPVRELELLLRGSDGQRAVFYAACRELQSAGEELRKAGKVFAPDGIMQFVSDDEAAAAARTVLELSGQADLNNVDRVVRETNLYENRLQIVQQKSDDENAKTQVQTGSNRLGPVQNIGPIVPLTDGNRLAPVQFNGVSDPGFGQVSRETGTKIAGFDTVPESEKKSQAMGILPSKRTQNIVSGESTPRGAYGSGGATGDALHETESEFGESLHETTSEFGEIRRGVPHESKSEFGVRLHETESELAEKVARRLAEGLRRAKWVRGG